MPNSARVAPGDVVYHVVNRANGRLRLFRKQSDFVAFYRVLLQAHERHRTRLLGWEDETGAQLDTQDYAIHLNR